jgi:hypothetical protein
MPEAIVDTGGALVSEYPIGMLVLQRFAVAGYESTGAAKWSVRINSYDRTDIIDGSPHVQSDINLAELCGHSGCNGVFCFPMV